MTRFATLAALSFALAGPAAAHDGHCGAEPSQPAFEEPTNAAEGLTFSIDMLEWTVDWALDLAETFGAPTGVERAEIDQAMAALDDLVALVASMESWGDPETWGAAADDPPVRKKGKRRRKGTVQARRG